MSKYSDLDRERVWRMHLEGSGYKRISAETGIPLPTVGYWVSRRKKAETVKAPPPIPAPKDIESADWSGVKYLHKPVNLKMLEAFEQVYYRKVPESPGDHPVAHMVGICNKVRRRMAFAGEWTNQPEECLPAFWKHLRMELTP